MVIALLVICFKCMALNCIRILTSGSMVPFDLLTATSASDLLAATPPFISPMAVDPSSEESPFTFASSSHVVGKPDLCLAY